MADISHMVGGDLTLGPTGDLATVSADLETQQRILRRLITNAGDYIWNLNYGGGLPKMIGNPAQADTITAIITAQIALEATVATSPAPTVEVTAASNGTVIATISYVDATTGNTQTLDCPLGG